MVRESPGVLCFGLMNWTSFYLSIKLYSHVCEFPGWLLRDGSCRGDDIGMRILSESILLLDTIAEFCMKAGNYVVDKFLQFSGA